MFNEHQMLIDDKNKDNVQSSSLEDVRRVLDARGKSKPSFFTKVQNLFDFDQRFVKDGKPIVSKLIISFICFFFFVFLFIIYYLLFRSYEN